MASPLSLRVDVDMSDLVKAAKNAGDAAEDLSDSFQDAGREASTASTEAVDALGDVDQAAQTTGGTLKDGLGGALQDVGGIATDAISGDVGGALEGVTGVIGNLGGAIPGIGTALSLAAGVAGAAFAVMQADAEATRQKVSDMYDDMVESGSLALSQTYLLAEAQALIGDEGRLAQAQTYADVLGIDLNTVIGAMVGNTQDLAAAQEALGGRLEDVGGKVSTFSSTQSEAAGKNQELFATLQAARGEFDKAGSAVDTAGGKYAAYTDFAADLTDTTNDANDAVSDLASSLTSLPPTTNATVKVTVDDSAVKRWTPPTWATTVTPRMGAVAP